MKRASPEPGLIRVCGVGRGLPYPNEEGWENIPAWSRGAEPWDKLSPFKIGPIQGCNNFESWWQSHKVWNPVVAQKGWDWKWPSEIHVDADNNPNEAWYKWHNALIANKHPVRRPNGRAIPLYAWWGGKKLGIVEARKQIYIPYLQKLYRMELAYQKLLEKVREGQSIIILEPDGPPPHLYTKGGDVTLESLIQLQDVTELKDFPGVSSKSAKYVPYGHGYVIALTLLEDLEKIKNSR